MEHFYNLFSNYGNIVKIVRDWDPASKDKLLIEYEGVESALIAKEYLQNLTLFKTLLEMEIGSHADLTHYVPTDTVEVFYGGYRTNRFREDRRLAINPPSNTLHVSNLVAEACRDSVIQSLFEAHGDVESLK
jgi:hypothetical protein